MDYKELTIENRANVLRSVITNTRCTNGFNSATLPLEATINDVMQVLKNLQLNKGVLYLVGNGGSAAIASHAMVDFMNVAKLHVQTLHESSLITCMANDYGYENSYSRVLSNILTVKDVLIAISSSGKSVNICNAAKVAKDKGCLVITLSGFQSENPLRMLGNFNFWLDTKDYGLVEIGHQFILHNLADRFGDENQKKTLQVEASACVAE